MKKLKGLTAGIIVALGLSSCTIIQPYAVTDHPVGSKKGVSKTGVILGAIYLNGDYGIADAAKNGRIKGPISTVDLKVTSYLIFSTKELIVTGDEN